MTSRDPLYVCSQLFYPELISTGLTLTELCEKLSDQGLSITVFCSQPTLISKDVYPKNMSYKNMQIKRCWSTRFSKLFFLGKLLNHLTFTISLTLKLFFLPQKSQLLLLTNPPILPWLMIFLYPFKRFRYSILLFDLYPETLIASKLLSIHNPFTLLSKILNKYVFQASTHVFVIGRCMKNRLLPYFSPSTLQKIHYIPIWANTENIQQCQSQLNFKASWNLNGKFIIGYSGNLARFHPIETIMHAAKLLQDHSDIVFLFVGEGYKKEWAMSFAKEHHLSQCHFKTYVPNEDLGALLSTFDYGIVGLNSENEGLSVPSKAMGLLSAGIPLIGLVPSQSEIALIINDYNCGITLDPNNPDALKSAILSLKSDFKKRESCHKNALRAVQERYNLNAIAKEYFHKLT
ncbi:hypothetical protein DID78_05120 [Candidatus Marinamargulisbacteria bacterium SCGC AG-343-D04]|nr:hypothetical protein DID78_05120 [Candidatus Marinamargulisbacteria bacterium SCGC AG-343-D04]